MIEVMEASYLVVSHLSYSFEHGSLRVLKRKKKGNPNIQVFSCIWLASEQRTCPNPDPKSMWINGFSTFFCSAAQLVGSQFPDQGLNQDHSPES